MVSVPTRRCANWCVPWRGRRRERHFSRLRSRGAQMIRNNMKNDRLLTVDDVAERLGISSKTVRREIGSGALESVRIGPAGRLIRVSETALAVYLVARNT